MKILQTKIGRQQFKNLLSPVILVLLSFIIASCFMLMVGTNPLAAYRELFKGAFGGLPEVIDTINKAIPICVAAFAVALAKKAGIFNIGVEGQLLFGALGSVLAGIYLKGLPPFIHIPAALLSGMLFGAAWSFIPALLYVSRKVNLLVVFIMMNSIAKLLITYFVVGPFAGENSLVSATAPIQSSAELPFIIERPNRLTIAIYIVILVTFLLYIFMYRTVWGYEIRAIGINREASGYSGLKIKKTLFFVLLLGGMLGGLAGGIEILGNYHRLYDGFSPGYGFDGIPIALLANGNPIGAIFGSLLFAALRVGSIIMQMNAGVSSEIVSVIQGLLVVFIAADYFVKFLLSRRKKKKEEI